HHYQVEVQLEGPQLDQHGYLLDIVDIEQRLERLVTRYRDQTLNTMPEFEGLNPSIEHFARILWEGMLAGGTPANLIALTVKIWENDIAWASFRREIA
ncbi:MAG: 6-carboxytetrahydropterin synthase, partial [Desulfomonile sp.]|nr:6-carboxytetrahydropterin synthase [Desulfomonile sp.]